MTGHSRFTSIRAFHAAADDREVTNDKKLLASSLPAKARSIPNSRQLKETVMHNPHPNHSFSILVSIFLLMVCGGLFSIAAPTGAHANGGAPLRLRLKVQKTTLRSDQSISIWADFLDGDYNQVENDATRVVEFSVAGPRGASGSISPQQVKVKPGERSAFASFNPEQAGRVLIKAQS